MMVLAELSLARWIPCLGPLASVWSLAYFSARVFVSFLALWPLARSSVRVLARFFLSGSLASFLVGSLAVMSWAVTVLVVAFPSSPRCWAEMQKP